MSILNRRNALIGWAVWSAGKFVAKEKARKAVPAVDTKTTRPNRSAMLLGGLAAAAGALLIWRRRGGESVEPLG